MLAQPRYETIRETAAGECVTLTGHDLTIQQVLRVARDGAKVALSPDALRRSADAYGLLLQAAAEGVPVYWFNRGGGDNRETTIFSGDPTSPENAAFLGAQQLRAFRSGPQRGYGPELHEEALVRAIMTIRANTMSYEAASPALTRRLTQLINHRITPVVQSRGTVGEADISIMSNIAGAMVGAGEVYAAGVRMPAAAALAAAGLEPLRPQAADFAAFTSTNAYAQAQALFAVEAGERLLDWADLSTALCLLGMNSSVTALAAPVQRMRPYPWLMWCASRILDLVRDSYLLEEDPRRIIQDPESLRAASQRQGAAWQAWAQLRDSLLLSINASDHNPAALPGLTPDSSWELGRPQFLRYFVKGGPLSGGKSGYVLSNANWDPYPLANQLEAFTIALANAGVAIAQRIERFRNPFFTVVSTAEVLSAEQMPLLPPGDGFLAMDLWQELASLVTPVTPAGLALFATVEDLEAQTRLKAATARKAIDLCFHLLAQDLLTAAHWVDVRRLQDPGRSLGSVPARVHAALREVVPWLLPPAQRPQRPQGELVYDFLNARPAAGFFPDHPPRTVPPLG